MTASFTYYYYGKKTPNLNWTAQPFLSVQFSRVKYINIVLKQIFRVFSFCRIEIVPIKDLPYPRPPAPGLLSLLWAWLSAPCWALTGRETTPGIAKYLHSLNKHPGQRSCQLEVEASWSWDRRMGFVRKSFISREREVTVCQSFADFSPVTKWACPAVSTEAEWAQAEHSCHMCFPGLVRLTGLSVSCPAVGLWLASVLPLFCLTLPLDS